MFSPEAPGCDDASGDRIHRPVEPSQSAYDAAFFEVPEDSWGQNKGTDKTQEESAGFTLSLYSDPTSPTAPAVTLVP